MSENAEKWRLFFTENPRLDSDKSHDAYCRRLGLIRGQSLNSIKSAHARYMTNGIQSYVPESFEKRNKDGSIDVKALVDRKLTDEEIFAKYGRSNLEWRIALVWFKDKTGGGYIMSCSFVPLKNEAKVLDDLKKELLSYSYKYKKIKYPKSTKPSVMLEISIYDLHYAKLCWREESGQDYDTKIAEQRFNTALDDFISRIKIYNVEKIVFVFGNDFFNSEGKSNATTAGTPQDTDSRWQKMFTGGRKLLVSGIEKLMNIAPVEVIGIYGNHANMSEFYLGDALECWFHNCPNVKVNNKPTARKYFSYGNSLLGFTHGNLEKEKDLPLLMASEVPDMWAKARYREFHRGDKHHEREMTFNTTVESKTVVVRTLCSMSGTDAWHKGAGYTGQRQSAMSFIWSKDNGLDSIHYHNVR